MKTVRGMFTDSQEIDTPAGFARFVKNALLTNTLAAIENEPGFSKFFDALPATVIGVEVIGDDVVLFTTDNTTCDDAGFSGIGILDKSGVYTNVLSSNEVTGLNFCTSAPIQIEHYKNFAGEKVISFIDDINVPRILNLDNPQINDINDLLLFPLASLPVVTTSVNDAGGSLETGTYYITYKYKNIDGAETNWFTVSGPVYINDERRGAGFAEYDGAPAGTASSKSIAIQITGTDPSFDQIILGVVKEIGGVRTAIEISTLTNSSTITTAYTGNETYTDLTLAEILVGIPSYTNAKAITQLNNRLYLGNMETADLLDYQLYANQIKVNYTTELIFTDTLTAGNHKLNGNKTFTPGEAYALYITWLLDDGSYSRAYHIPGRPEALRSGGVIITNQSIQQFREPDRVIWPSSAFTQAVFPTSAGNIASKFPNGTHIVFNGGINGYYSNPSGQFIVDSYYDAGYGQTMVVFQRTFSGDDQGVTTQVTQVSSPVYETDISTKANTRGLGSDIPIFRVENTANNPNAETNMGYWENENELYSIGFPGLEGQNVRHHKMPSLRAVYENLGTSAATGKNSHVILGIDVSNVQVPAEIADKVQSYQILYAKKDLGNSLVITHDRLELAGIVTAGENLGEKMPSGGNWDVRPLGDSYDNNSYGSQLRTPDKNTHLSYALDLISQYPAISPDYVELHYRLGVTNLNSDYTGTYGGNGVTITRSGADGENYPMGNILDYGASQGASFVALLADDEFLAIENFKYIPGGALDNDLNNTRSPGCAYWEVSTNSVSAMNAIPWATFPSLRPKSPSGATTDNFDSAYGLTAETYVISLHNLLSDVHNALTSQSLVMTNKINKITGAGTYAVSDVFGGDGFISYQTVISSTSPTNRDSYWNDPSKDQYQNPRFFNCVTVPSKNNWNFRHMIAGDVNTWYYPKIEATEFFDPDPNSRPRIFIPGESFELYNAVEYNSDYSSINDFKEFVVYDPSQRFQTTFPNLIVRSIAQANDATVQSWRNFLAADRYTTIKSKGPIVNLQGVANEQMIIHLEDSLYITRDRTTLQNDIDASRVSLGAGDIFDLTPKELVTSDKGHAGTQHRFSCKLTKLGYAFTDVKQGKVFLLQGFTDLKEISKLHMRNFFRDFIPEGIGDNPFIHDGITVDLDEKYNRLLLSFNKGSESFTISYIPEKESWASYHDYQPGFLYSIRDKNKLYSINNGYSSDRTSTPTYAGVYLHNDTVNGTRGIFYNLNDETPVPYPMLLDVPVTSGEDYNQLIFQALEWSSEVRAKTGEYIGQETLDKITVRTPTLTTGPIALVAGTASNNVYSKNIRNTETVWHFNKLRNLSQPNVEFLKGFHDNFDIDTTKLLPNRMWYDKARFIDKYAIVRFEYSNLYDRQFLLLDYTLFYGQSFR